MGKLKNLLSLNTWEQHGSFKIMPLNAEIPIKYKRFATDFTLLPYNETTINFTISNYFPEKVM